MLPLLPPVEPSCPSGSRYWVSGFPRLVEEWDAERNGALTPHTVSAGSGRMIWWRCRRGRDHRWRAKPNNRALGSGCPFCANRRVSITNSLAARFPRVAREWHPIRNGEVHAADVVATSTRVAWWRCRADPVHEWRATVRDRTRLQSACPYCARRRVSDDTSLAASHPAVAAEWHPTRNCEMSPADVLPGSRRIVWWKCAVDPTHEWRATIANRVLRASQCPYCSRRRSDPSRAAEARRAQ
jgi:hypothetical protein